MRQATDIEVIRQMPEADYHAIKRLSSSWGRQVLECPSKVKESMQNPSESSAAQRDGSRFHVAALEPGRIWQAYAIQPEVDRRTKSGKEVYAAWLEESAGKEPCSASDIWQTAGMTQTIHQHSVIEPYLAGERELSVFWTDYDTGVECKARLDCLGAEGRGWVLDLKSCREGKALRQSWIWEIKNWSYHVQAHWYLWAASLVLGREVRDFWHLVVEKVAPYPWGLFKLGPNMLEQGESACLKMLYRWQECEATQYWPHYTENPQLVDW